MKDKIAPMRAIRIFIMEIHLTKLIGAPRGTRTLTHEALNFKFKMSTDSTSRAYGAPTRIRTETERGLSSLPLPIGSMGACGVYNCGV